MALPKLSDAERKAALKKAVEVRRQRAALKADVKKGKVKLADIIKKTNDPVIAKMRVSSLLSSLPGVGKARAQTLMEKVGIDASRRVQGLGTRQVEGLLKETK
ncbi:MAG: integration host factor, actinobacterial type [Candidatus Subteraquimicrobiales bacterium]|nr:integration host factor, actinobacterial type [Candidatus Subteraquimicrobiales bacterium]